MVIDVSSWGDMSDHFRIPRMQARVLWVLNDGAVHSSLDVMQQATGNTYVGEQTAAVHVTRLRKALQPHGYTIDRVRNQGYQLRPIA